MKDVNDGLNSNNSGYRSDFFMNFVDLDGNSLREQPRILQSSLACKDLKFGDATVFGA